MQPTSGTAGRASPNGSRSSPGANTAPTCFRKGEPTARPPVELIVSFLARAVPPSVDEQPRCLAGELLQHVSLVLRSVTSRSRLW
jgi:hypothetical protein